MQALKRVGTVEHLFRSITHDEHEVPLLGEGTRRIVAYTEVIEHQAGKHDHHHIPHDPLRIDIIQGREVLLTPLAVSAYILKNNIHQPKRVQGDDDTQVDGK